jgi:cellulose synthase/poly-beta-1,6-N-acetylglucosamine synthase-like glycosyltransferase
MAREILVTLLEFLLGAAALLAFLPVAVLFAEVLLAVTSRRGVATPLGERRRLAIVMPAHNEASIIVSTLRSIVPQLGKSDRLIVVADNCSDETAALAASEGAEVVVRTELTRRGKGYALDYGVRHLDGDAPDIVIILDADCQVATDSIDRLARLCVRSARPVQALYLMQAPKHAGIMTRIAEFAWVIKNQVRPAGLHRLRLPCHLMGTGMAFPWTCISTARLATGHIVEDRKLGIDLACAGMPPLFCPEALVTSYFPASSEGIDSQRSRWEHGSLGVILSETPRLVRSSLRLLNVSLMILALDLAVPPLAFLALQVLAIWVASVLFYLHTKVQFPAAMATAAAVLLALSVLLSWGRYGRRIIPLSSLAFAVLYALWKIPLYARFLISRQQDWVRSKRGDDGDPPQA